MKDYRVRMLLLGGCGLVLLLGLLAYTKCLVPSNPIEQHKIYFVAAGQGIRQIWQTDMDGTEPHMIYEIRSSLDRSASAVLPQLELSVLEDYLASITPTLTSDQVYLSPGISKMRLSPDKQKLAWIAINGGCHTPGAQVGCFAGQRLVSFDISTGIERVYWQASAHPTGELFMTAAGVDSIAWSPNNRYIAFSQDTNRDVPCSPILRIVDIQTQEIREIGIGGSLTWSPDGQHLASITCGMKGAIIRIYTVESGAVQEFPTEYPDFYGAISWSGLSNRIAFMAEPGRSEDRARLYTLEIETGDIQEVLQSENESYEHPQWSPDGRLIAVDARPGIGEFHNKLLILDPKSKNVVAQLSEERADLSWQWSADSKSILILLGNRTTPPALGIFLIETNTLTRVPLPSVMADSLPNRAPLTSAHSFTTIPEDDSILWISQPNW